MITSDIGLSQVIIILESAIIWSKHNMMEIYNTFKGKSEFKLGAYQEYLG